MVHILLLHAMSFFLFPVVSYLSFRLQFVGLRCDVTQKQGRCHEQAWAFHGEDSMRTVKLCLLRRQPSEDTM